MKVASAVVIAIFSAAVGATWWALESGGVAVIQTRTPDGSVRSTHVWFVRPNGELWIEAGSPDNPWFQDVQRDPVVSLVIDSHTETYLAEPVDHLHAHSRIRTLLRAKYGRRDRLVGLFVDTSRSVSVRLTPRTARAPKELAPPNQVLRLTSEDAP